MHIPIFFDGAIGLEEKTGLLEQYIARIGNKLKSRWLGLLLSLSMSLMSFPHKDRIKKPEKVRFNLLSNSVRIDYFSTNFNYIVLNILNFILSSSTTFAK